MLVTCVFLSSCSKGGESTSSLALGGEESDGSYEIETGAPLENVSGAVDPSDLEFKKKDYWCDIESGYSEIALSDSAESSGNGYVCSGGSVSIVSAGTYVLSGKLSNGQIVVSASKEDDVRIVLSGVDICSLRSAPILVTSCDKVIISLAKDTVNTVEDKSGSTLENGEEISACIYSKESVSINGEGTLNVKANVCDSITSKDTLKITGGVINIDAADDGIVGRDRVLVCGGTLSVNAVGDAIKSTNDDAALGYVYISDGDFNITCDGDGICAKTSILIEGGRFIIKTGGGAGNVNSSGQISGGGFFGGFKPGGSVSSGKDEDAVSMKALKASSYLDIVGGEFNIDSADDALHSNGNVRISGALIEICTGDDGVHADSQLMISGGRIIIEKSYEGLEGSDINISGGYIKINSSDDGINAAGGSDGNTDDGRFWNDRFNASQNVNFVISGGEIYVNASGDGVDSNKDIAMNGGILCVCGPTNDGNGYIDVEGQFYVNGGIYIGVGRSGMLVTPSANSEQNSITTAVSGTAGSTLTVKDSDGNALVSMICDKTYTTVTFSSPEIKLKEKYTFCVDSKEKTTVTATSVSTLSGVFGTGNQMPGQNRPPKH